MSDAEIQILIKKALQMHEKGELRMAADLYRSILQNDSNNVEALNLLGAVLTEAGLYEQALQVLRQSLAAGGPNSGVLYNYGVALRSVDRLVEASRAFKNAAEVNPEWADCWFNLGETYRRLENHQGAINALQKATTIETNNANFYLNLGNAYLDAGRANEAIKAYQAALQLEHNIVEARNNLGIALRQIGKLDEAVHVYKDILDRHPANAAAQNNLGLALAELGQSSEAEEAFASAINIAPEYIEAKLNMADLYLQAAEFENAALYLNKAISTNSQNPDVLVKLGIVLQKQGRLEEAREVLSNALGLESVNNLASTVLANVLRDLGEFESALTILEKLPINSPGYTGTMANLALIHQHQGAIDKAENLLRLAIEREPDNAALHTNLAHTLLLSGKFQDGWEEFHWRLQEPLIQRQLSSLPGNLWEGGDLSGKSVLVVCEQGAGDCFQFIRLVPLLAAQAKELVLSVPPRLFRILRNFSDCCKIISKDDAVPNSDIHVPLMGLPHLMGINDIPAPIPYLRAEEGLTKEWAECLSGNNFKVGLNWQGNRAYETDYLRSIPFNDIEPLVESGLADFVSMQKGATAESIPNKSNFLNLGSALDIEDGFVDTAAVMMDLDLIITSDTASAHLAGALGKPVWVLLNSAPDWRWLLEREDTPWYPTMRLFRQPSPRDWPSVVTAVQNALKDLRQTK